MLTSAGLFSSEQSRDCNTSAITQAILDRYRCPTELLQIGISGKLSSHAGFFLFRNTVCYGRSTSGIRRRSPNASLYDTHQDVNWTDRGLNLPFSPTEVIENLRLERYPGAELGGALSFLKRAYYSFRPPLRSLRSQIQRLYAHTQRRSSFPSWPVDTSVEEICETVLSQALIASGSDEIPFVWFWPRGARACAVMTHDVETETGRDHCETLMDIDDEFGIKASFQIVPQERYPVPVTFLDSIRRRGFEIALQDLNHDGRLFGNEQEFRRRAALINQYAKSFGAEGFRAAVLYRKPDWYKYLDISFDMSIPNVARLDPQPGGCCTVMPYFIGDILELPVTTVQDYMLLHILNEHSINLWKAQAELILKKNGLMSFIVHPDYITDPEEQFLYRELLAYLREMCANEKVWFTLPSEVNRWWRTRNQLSVVRQNGSWVIRGDGAEQATLAFAKKVNGRLEYECMGH